MENNEMTYEACMEYGKKYLKDKCYEEAIELFSTGLRNQVNKHGSLSPECADAYFMYGKALFESFQDNDDIFFDKGKSKVGSNNKSASLSPKYGGHDAKDDCKKSENGNKSKDADDGLAISSDEDPTVDLQLAWENMEVARVLYSKFDDAVGRRKLSETIFHLGLIEFESGRNNEAYQEIIKALQILESIDEPKESKLLAIMCFYIGLILSDQQKYSEALVYFERSRDVLVIQLNKLKENFCKHKSEINELNTTISQLDDKIQDCSSCLDPLYSEKIPVEEKAELSCESLIIDASHLIKRKAGSDDKTDDYPREETSDGGNMSIPEKIKKSQDS